jgi:hypothetical protein
MIALETVQQAGHSEPEGRLLHLLDVENLVGSADFSREKVATMYRAYLEAAPHGLVDQLVAATSHHSALAAWFGLPERARRLVQSGADGADLELLRVLAFEAVELRYDRIVIGSGDGIFAGQAARIQGAGGNVTVVTRPEALSRRLRLAVRDIRFLDPGDPVAIGLPLEAA